MFKDLPLNALRAFEATARLGEIKIAAAELFVTPAAVSQQLKKLESHFCARIRLKSSPVWRQKTCRMRMRVRYLPLCVS